MTDQYKRLPRANILDLKVGVSKAEDGSTAVPSMSFQSDPDTGLYKKDTNTVGCVTGGNEKWYCNTNGMVVNSALTVVGRLATTTTVTDIGDTAPTLTATQLINGLILGIPTAARNITLPSAAGIKAALPNSFANDSSFEFAVRNDSAGAFSFTVVAGTGITLATGNTNTVAQAHTRLFRVVFTNVESGTEAATVYSLVDSAH